MPGPEAPEPDAAQLSAALAAAGLTLAPAQLPGVLATAQYLHRATGLVAAYLAGHADAPR